MTLNGFESLALVRRYLATEVVAIVPHHVAAELRAVVKLLDTAMIELAELPLILPAEIAAMRDLCREGQAVLATGNDEVAGQACIQAQGDPTMRNLRELIEEHREAGEQLGRLITRLQGAQSSEREDAHAYRLSSLLDRIYQVLGRQADDRLTWQSVFPAFVVSGKGILSTSNPVQECSK